MLSKTANGEKEATFKYNGGESTDPIGLKLQLSAGWWKKRENKVMLTGDD